MAGDQEVKASVHRAPQKEPMQGTTPRRRRGGWGSPLPLQDQQLALSTHVADHIAADSLHRGQQSTHVTLIKMSIRSWSFQWHHLRMQSQHDLVCF